MPAGGLLDGSNFQSGVGFKGLVGSISSAHTSRPVLSVVVKMPFRKKRFRFHALAIALRESDLAPLREGAANFRNRLF